jgi:hypothetical protein
MARRKDSADQLCQELLGSLERARGRGPEYYPLSLRSLAGGLDPRPPDLLVSKAAGKRSFDSRIVTVRRRNLDSPVALVEDLELLAGSGLVLEFLLKTLGTDSNQAFSIAQLKARTSSKLQKAFQLALTRQVEENRLPPMVGWISIHRSRKLFFLADVHVAGERPSPSAWPSRGQPMFVPQPDTEHDGEAAPLPNGGQRALDSQGLSFVQAFDCAFQELDRQAGGPNLVSLLDLRRALAVSREQFDQELRRLRLSGRYGLSAAEGRFGLRAEEQQAGLLEDGTLLLYVSRKSS